MSAQELGLILVLCREHQQIRKLVTVVLHGGWGGGAWNFVTFQYAGCMSDHDCVLFKFISSFKHASHKIGR